MTGSHNHSSEAPNLSQNLSQGRDGLSPRKRAILDYLQERPGATVREIGEAVGLRSSSSTFEQLWRMEEKGLLKQENCPRCDGKIWLVNGEEVVE